MRPLNSCVFSGLYVSKHNLSYPGAIHRWCRCTCVCVKVRSWDRGDKLRERERESHRLNTAPTQTWPSHRITSHYSVHVRVCVCMCVCVRACVHVQRCAAWRQIFLILLLQLYWSDISTVLYSLSISWWPLSPAKWGRDLRVQLQCVFAFLNPDSVGTIMYYSVYCRCHQNQPETWKLIYSWSRFAASGDKREQVLCS